MTKTTTHLCAAALGLLLTVPASARGQSVSERPAPATPVAVPSKRPAMRPNATVTPGIDRVVKVESKQAAAPKHRAAERLRKRRPER